MFRLGKITEKFKTNHTVNQLLRTLKELRKLTNILSITHKIGLKINIDVK